jgi:GNAT superfamily N-acetyltransferase
MKPAAWPVVELLGSHHDRAAFSCGEAALDTYLQRQAAQDMKRRVARVFVARGSTPAMISGYYTLSAAAFDRDELPLDLSKRLPHYPVPAAILGRLAVDRSCQGRGYGGFLLLDAVERVLKASGEVAINAVVVDAKNDAARAFYEHFGFIAFPRLPRRLFLPLATFAKAGL